MSCINIIHYFKVLQACQEAVETTHLIKWKLFLLRTHIHRKKASQYFKFLKHYLKAIYSNIKVGAKFKLFKLSPHFCKDSGIPTMLVTLSFLFVTIPFIYPLFMMCHLHRKIGTINQLIKIDSSSINCSRENQIILTYQGINFSTLLRKYCTICKVH